MTSLVSNFVFFTRLLVVCLHSADVSMLKIQTTDSVIVFHWVPQDQ